MQTFPNQKIVHIAKREKRDKDHLYSMMNIEALSKAISELNGAGLKMWLYFNKNQDDFDLALSQKDALNFGVKKDSYYNGIKELEQKGYLVPLKENSNIYYFYENPSSEKTKLLASEKPIWFSETSTEPSDETKKESEKPERNNTNITSNNTNNTNCSKFESTLSMWESEEKRKYMKSLGF